MKKLMRKICSVLVIAMAFSTISLTPFAKENESETMRYSDPVEMFAEICENFFETQRGVYRAIDKNGIDVTGDFLNRYQTAYGEKQYSVIEEGFDRELSTITWKECESGSKGARASTVSDSVKQNYYIRETAKFGSRSESFQAVVAVGGSYEYVSSTRLIIGHNNGSVSLVSYSTEPYCVCELRDISASASVASNKKSVYFTGTFKIKFSFKNGDVVTDYKIFGPYSKSVTGYTS